MAKSRAALRAEFLQFHRANPHIWRLLKKFALQAKRSKCKERIGISLLIERLRWEVLVQTQSKDGFKFNNNHSAFYARRLMRKCPELKGFFTLRKQKK